MAWLHPNMRSPRMLPAFGCAATAPFEAGTRCHGNRRSKSPSALRSLGEGAVECAALGDRAGLPAALCQPR
eukprot:4393715-Pyramimonas_sp.AAC.1